MDDTLVRPDVNGKGPSTLALSQKHRLDSASDEVCEDDAPFVRGSDVWRGGVEQRHAVAVNCQFETKAALRPHPNWRTSGYRDRQALPLSRIYDPMLVLAMRIRRDRCIENAERILQEYCVRRGSMPPVSVMYLSQIASVPALEPISTPSELISSLCHLPSLSRPSSPHRSRTNQTMSSAGLPRRTSHLPHSPLFLAPTHSMSHKDRAILSYRKAKAIGLAYGALLPPTVAALCI